MSPVLCALALLLGAASEQAAPDRLEQARTHLEAGRLEEVLFALDGAEPAGPEKAVAAGLLARAARASWKGGDRILALQFVQMALRNEPAQPQALEVGARVALGEYQFDAAERYADGWLKATGRGPAARVLRAQIALAQGEWKRSLELVDGIPAASLSADERDVLQMVRDTAQRELKDRKAGLSSVRALEARLVDAEVAAKKLERVPEARAARAGGVVLYGTSWCGYCKKARRFLKEHHVAYVDKDVERDGGAAEELAQKARAAGVRATGVPVIDVRGQLVNGFDEDELRRLLGL